MTIENNSGICIFDVTYTAVAASSPEDFGENLPLVAGAKWSPYSYGRYWNYLGYSINSDSLLRFLKI